MSCVSLIAGGTARADWEKTFARQWRGARFVGATNQRRRLYCCRLYGGGSGISNADVFLVKTDSTGNRTWSQTFGSSGIDMAHCVRPTADGGYIATGATQQAGHVDFDVYLIKTDAAGNLQWSKTFGDNGDDYGYAVRQTADGGLYPGGLQSKSSGNRRSDRCLSRQDRSPGQRDVVENLRCPSTGAFRGCPTNHDGGYIAVGAAEDSGSGYVYVVKTDTAGTATWSQTFANSRYDFSQTVNQTSDGGFVLSATTDDHNARIIKTDSGGNPEWSRGFNVPGAFETTCQAAIQTRDDGYALIGTIAETPYDLRRLRKTAASATRTPICSRPMLPATKPGARFSTRTVVRTLPLCMQTVDGLYVVTGRQANSALLIWHQRRPDRAATRRC